MKFINTLFITIITSFLGVIMLLSLYSRSKGTDFDYRFIDIIHHVDDSLNDPNNFSSKLYNTFVDGWDSFVDFLKGNNLTDSSDWVTSIINFFGIDTTSETAYALSLFIGFIPNLLWFGIIQIIGILALISIIANLSGYLLGL